jgi:lysophospholipase L1-like esterase
MSRRTLVIALAGLTVLLASAASCRPGTPQECNGTTPTTTGEVVVVCPTTTTTDVPPPPQTVLVLGDSITAQSALDIRTALTAAGFEPIVAGYAGYSALDTSVTGRPTLGTVIDDFVDDDPDIVILEAGTNDINTISAGGASVADLVARMGSFRDTFPQACVAVTTVTTHRDDRVQFNMTATLVNAELRSAFLRVVPWDETEWALRQSGTTILQEDDIHPLPAGRQVLAELDTEAAQDCP